MTRKTVCCTGEGAERLAWLFHVVDRPTALVDAIAPTWEEKLATGEFRIKLECWGNEVQEPTVMVRQSQRVMATALS